MMSVVVHQKHVLPHAHLLFWLTNKDAFLSPENVDEIISPQMPKAKRLSRIFSS